jgi:hypothetical protein
MKIEFLANNAVTGGKTEFVKMAELWLELDFNALQWHSIFHHLLLTKCSNDYDARFSC